MDRRCESLILFLCPEKVIFDQNDPGFALYIYQTNAQKARKRRFFNTFAQSRKKRYTFAASKDKIFAISVYLRYYLKFLLL